MLFIFQYFVFFCSKTKTQLTHNGHSHYEIATRITHEFGLSRLSFGLKGFQCVYAFFSAWDISDYCSFLFFCPIMPHAVNVMLSA